MAGRKGSLGYVVVAVVLAGLLSGIWLGGDWMMRELRAMHGVHR